MESPPRLFCIFVKMKLKAILLPCLFIFFMTPAGAQIKDSASLVPLIDFSFSFQVPGADLSDRFGNNADIAIGFHVKTQKNWIIGGRVSHLFGDDIRENGILDSISTSSGAIISGNGQFASVRLFERGMTWTFQFGKLFPIAGPNSNSGIYFNLGFGGIFHKIRIEDVGNVSPQLSTEYKKGYDRLTSGQLFTQSLGFLYLSNNKRVNFFGCLEAFEGITTSRRSFNFDTMEADTETRLDMLFGARIGWVLPLYKRTARELYYH